MVQYILKICKQRVWRVPDLFDTFTATVLKKAKNQGNLYDGYWTFKVTTEDWIICADKKKKYKQNYLVTAYTQSRYLTASAF